MIEDNSLGLEFKYLIVNDMDRKFGLWVNTVGYQSIPPDSPYPLKEHPSGYFFNAEKGRVLREYQLVYITKGYKKTSGVYFQVSPDVYIKTNSTMTRFRMLYDTRLQYPLPK